MTNHDVIIGMVAASRGSEGVGCDRVAALVAYICEAAPHAGVSRLGNDAKRERIIYIRKEDSPFLTLLSSRRLN